MQSKQELYNSAMRAVNARRQVARLEAQQRQAALRASLPGLAPLEAKRRQAGMQAALQSAKGEGGSASAALAACKQEIAALLVANGHPADALEIHYTCPRCRDTGLLEGRVCECVKLLMRQARRKEIEASSALSLCSFDTMELKWYPNTPCKGGRTIRQHMQLNLEELRLYAEDFSHNNCNLLLTGNAGLGKTHAALAIAGVVLNKGYDVIYLSAPELFGQLESYHFGNDSAAEAALMDAVCEADLFILDDLGTEMLSSYTLAQFYTLLNRRMNSRTATIITTNIMENSLLEKRYTEKIASRLNGSFELFLFLGNDIRLQKNIG